MYIHHRYFSIYNALKWAFFFPMSLATTPAPTTITNPPTTHAPTTAKPKTTLATAPPTTTDYCQSGYICKGMRLKF